MKVFGIVLITLFIGFCSCNRLSTKSTSPFCENELALICPDSGVKILELDYKMGHDSLRDWILAQLDTVNCKETQSFGIKLRNGLVLNARVEKDCGVMRCFTDRNHINVLINDFGQILLEHEFCQIDSLIFLLSRECQIARNQSTRCPIALKWSRKVGLKAMERILIDISKGYLQVADSVANQKYKKGVCLLDAKQLSEVKKELTFNILFWRTPAPPPPPPPAENRNDVK